MKRCPDCFSQYDDNISFCTKDGRALVTADTSRARLCPHCANSIEEDAVKCPYCKADFGAAETPQWPMREEMAGQVAPSGRHRSWRNRAKAMSAAGVVVIILSVLLLGGYRQWNDGRRLEETNLKQLQEREQKIKTLEGELKELRQELDKSKTDLIALAAKLQQNQKELSATEQRLATATRESERLASKRAPVTPGSTLRSAKAPAAPTKAPPSPTPPARRPAEPGVYEVIRATTVREEPSGGARRITEINKGTKITVVRTVGDWLEVRSKQGNPPGYVRLGDAILVSRAN